eukprot:TRINITY_DN7211_c0_g1_i1.p1 TRINITY_DN7211_c0_g1~~TRINITY_DN7211_c0_g1_i1.p1  ORF type:complete len:392 (-),score=50.72 TRINITY_DN7211_c0_g1_i1:32-1207(-)
MKSSISFSQSSKLLRHFTSGKARLDRVAIWGRGDRGQLGLGVNKELQISPAILKFPEMKGQVVSLHCGQNHTVCVSDHGEIYSFGVGKYGALGLGSTEDQWTPRKVSDKVLERKRVLKVACGGDHTLIATDSSEGLKVFSCGRNNHGQLGIQNIKSANSFQEVKALRGKEIAAMSLGEDFSIVATSSGEIFSFGRSDVRQLGRDSTHENPWRLDSGVQINQLSSGWGHTLASTSKGIFSWGANLHSQCGTGAKSESSAPKLISFAGDPGINGKVACGSCHSMVLLDGKVVIFGSGADGKMAKENSKEDVLAPKQMSPEIFGKVKQVACGSDHLCVFSDNGDLWLWGYGQHGTLALPGGLLKTVATPQLLRSSVGKFSAVACGNDMTVALLD